MSWKIDMGNGKMSGAWKRFDTAMRCAFELMVRHFTDFRVKVTKEAEDGEAMEYTFSIGRGKEYQVVYRVFCS